MSELPNPKTLVAAVRLFADPDVALAYAVKFRWPDGATCPECNTADPIFISTRRIWKCRACRRQFSVKTGSIMEDSPLSLDKWLIALWMLANCKNGVSSYEIHRALDITQKSAWFLLHRLRYAMIDRDGEPMTGIVEADETFVGGKGTMRRPNKTIVMGVVSRDSGTVRTELVPDVKSSTLQPMVRANVAPGSSVYTDNNKAYVTLRTDYRHESVSHYTGEYVRGDVHTNNVESFWGCLKRALKGTYINVDPVHLGAYVDEQTFRYNNRGVKDGDRFEIAGPTLTGKRLTYDRLIGKECFKRAQ